MTAREPHSVYDAFAASAAEFPQRPFLNVLDDTAAVYAIDAGEIRYRPLHDEIAERCAAYRDAGYRAGQRVLLLVENRPAFFVHWLALNRLGLSIVPLNPDLRAAELSYIAGHAEPALAVAIDGRVDDLAAALADADSRAAVITPEQIPPPPASAGAADAATGVTREAALLYTSGTTGRPKGCVLSNRYFLAAGRWYRDAGGLCALSQRPDAAGDRDEGERMITPLPLFHMNALAYSTMAMIEVGGCLSVLDRFHPRRWWHSVRASRASCLHYLGIMPTLLMQADADPADRDHRVRFGFGAGVDPQLQRPFEQRFGFPLVEAWAMTETGAGAVVAANRPPRRVGRGSFGRPGPSLQLRIVTDGGADAGDDEPGELWVRGAGDDPRDGFFSQYYRDPAASAEAWRDGWFHTGDVIKRDRDGELIFVDRKKNVIRRSGENIAAVEVESVLSRHRDVAAVAVAAVADALRGDEVLACVVARRAPPDAAARAALAASLFDYCRGQLAYYKAPGYVVFVDRLPLTATQKIQRGELKTLAARWRDDAATVDLRAQKKRQR